jgi:hypothetical protein
MSEGELGGQASDVFLYAYLFQGYHLAALGISLGVLLFYIPLRSRDTVRIHET